MALFSAQALQPGVRKREVLGWAMYDFANSGYTTVVLTAVFNAYFVGVVVGDRPWATLAWTLTLASASLLVMLTIPALGAWADRHGAKKRVLAVSTVGCVLTTAALSWAGPGDLAWAVVALVLSNMFFGWGESMTAAFLPELARRDSLGKVSGWGWSFGYFGGMLSLGLCLAHVLSAKAAGQSAEQFVPVTLWITAGIFALASLPTFLLLRERALPQQRHADHLRPAGAWQQLRASWQAAQHHLDFRWLLACGVAYQAGIAVVIALAAVYAEQVLGFAQADTMMLVFLVNIASALGAFAWGHVQDRIGHRPALALTLWGWLVMILLAAMATTRPVFWAAAVVAGLCMGASQSAGRALAGLLSPPDRLAEFYGLWTFAVRLSSIVGPITYGLVTWLSDGNHRLAILCTGLFFAAGLWLLRRVDVGRGAAAAGLAPQTATNSAA